MKQVTCKEWSSRLGSKLISANLIKLENNSQASLGSVLHALPLLVLEQLCRRTGAGLSGSALLSSFIGLSSTEASASEALLHGDATDSGGDSMFICRVQILIQWDRFVEQPGFVLHRLLVRIALERVTDLLVFMGAGVALLSTDSAVERETRSHQTCVLYWHAPNIPAKPYVAHFAYVLLACMGVYCICLHCNLVGRSHDSANVNVAQFRT